MGFILFNACGGITVAIDQAQVQGLGPPVQLSSRFITVRQGLQNLGARLVLVSKYCFPVQKNWISLEKCPTLGQGQEVCRMNLEHLVTPESKEGHCGRVQRTQDTAQTGSHQPRWKQYEHHKE